MVLVVLNDTDPIQYGTVNILLDTATPGALLYVEKSGAAQFHAYGTVAWGANATTQIQAVPEDQFVSGVATIVPGRVDTNSRYAIRLYAVRGEGARIAVREYEMGPFLSSGHGKPEEVVWTTTVTLLPPPNDMTPCPGCDLPIVPYRTAIAELFNVPLKGRNIRFEFEPESPTLRYWAIVSATSNTTNAAGIYTFPR